MDSRGRAGRSRTGRGKLGSSRLMLDSATVECMNVSEIVDTVPAYLVGLTEARVRYYAQARTLAGETDPGIFREAVDSFRANFGVRPQGGDGTRGQIVDLSGDEADPDGHFRETVGEYFARLGIDAKEAESLFRDYGWKMRQLPDGVGRILSVGCGGGRELIFLRSRYPEAQIVALDYGMGVEGGSGTLDILGVEFVAGDIFESTKKLGADGPRFDLIFSNHVIEHFYDPDEQISELCSLLKAGGLFTAGVPLDAYPLSDLLAERSRDPQSTNALDIDWLDLRHPWKTNEADLARTLLGAGMGSVVLFRRVHHANNSKCEVDLSLEGCTQREMRARRIESLTLQPWIGAMKLLFGRNPPRRLARLVFAMNRRLWFGRYRLKCDIQPEVFATAVRNG